MASPVDFSSYLITTPGVPTPSSSSTTGMHSLHPNDAAASHAPYGSNPYFPSSSASPSAPSGPGQAHSAAAPETGRPGASSSVFPPSSSSHHRLAAPNASTSASSSALMSAAAGPSHVGGTTSFEDSAGWNMDDAFNSGDVAFQLPSFLGHARTGEGGGVETFPTRSMGDWNSSGGALGNAEVMWDSSETWNNDAAMFFPSPQPGLSNFQPPCRDASDASSDSPSDGLNLTSMRLDRSTPSSVSSASVPLPSSSAHVLPAGPTMATQVPPVGKTMPGLYSSSGFDVLGVLSRVVGRANPRTVLGPVDFSCSFLVTDVQKFDNPIVYCSPTFCQLTGYDAKDIVGKNCRFLQAPDGDIPKGSRRRYTDNVAVSHLARQLAQQKECQASLINYRKGGVPFINLVTIIPIPWETEEVRFHVGFQVDLVESPNAILRNIRDGTYQVNYAILNPPGRPLAPAGQQPSVPLRLTSTVFGKEMIAVMERRAYAEDGNLLGDDALRTEWFRTLFDHSDDFIHVLSLKGQFQYVSPSVRRVLEFEAEDLVHKSISDICHPSDVMPIMRELKEATLKEASSEGGTKTVNFLFRVRRKQSGMIWLECTGRLFEEPGKGRKSVILCGREKVIPSLGWDAVEKMGGVGPREIWCSLSFEGLVLHASNPGGDVAAFDSEAFVGQSIFDLIPATDRAPSSSSASPFVPANEPPHLRCHRALTLAKTGVPQHAGTAVQHELTLPSLSSSSSSPTLEVSTVFYSVSSPKKRWDDAGGDSTMMDGVASPMASDASSISSAGYEVELRGGPSKRKVRPNTILCQIRLLPSSVASSSVSRRPTKPLVHSTKTDVFSEIDLTRSTGWQYELHQLQNDNRKLRESVAALRASGRRANGGKAALGAGGAGGDKGAVKRKMDEGEAMMGPPKQVPSKTATAVRQQQQQQAPQMGYQAPQPQYPQFLSTQRPSYPAPSPPPSNPSLPPSPSYASQSFPSSSHQQPSYPYLPPSHPSQYASAFPPLASASAAAATSPASFLSQHQPLAQAQPSPLQQQQQLSLQQQQQYQLWMRSQQMQQHQQMQQQQQMGRSPLMGHGWPSVQGGPQP